MEKVRKTVIYYFSGTGNARQVANWLFEFAVRKDIDCQIVKITRPGVGNIDAPSPDALIIIISPVHGFNFPKITLDFIRRFPEGKNRVVLMNTRAGMKLGRFITPGLTGIAFWLSSLFLKLKGYKIAGQIPFDMPSNWISIHPALNENTVRYIHEKIYSRVEKHADKIFSGKSDFLSFRDLVPDMLIAPVSLAYYLAGRFAFAKSFYASDRCDHCGICEKLCPVKAIKTAEQHPYWTFKCESCMKCMNSCPQKAIETAHGLLVVTSVLSSATVTILLDSMLVEETRLIRTLLGTLVFFAQLWLFYNVQHLLLKNKFFARLIASTSLTHYHFWGRYKSIPDSKWKK